MKARITVRGVTVYYDSRKALDNVSLTVGEGEVLSIVGPNGSGKTTLLKTIEHIVKPRSGAVYVNGKNITEYRRRELAKIMAYVPQAFSGTQHFTVLDFVLTGRRPHVAFSYSRSDIEKALHSLKLVNALQYASRPLDTLSGGELQRVVIARALAQEPEILLLDEPTSNLDLKHQVEILELLRRLAREQGLTIIVALHDLTHAYRYSDKVVLLHKGRVYAMGEPDEVLNEENIEAVYGVKVVKLKDLKAIVVLYKMGDQQKRNINTHQKPSLSPVQGG